MCHTRVAHLCVRDRIEDSRLKHHSILIDAGNEDLAQDAVRPVVTVPLDTDNTWYVVKPDESVIFTNQMGMFLLSLYI